MMGNAAARVPELAEDHLQRDHQEEQGHQGVVDELTEGGIEEIEPAGLDQQVTPPEPLVVDAPRGVRHGEPSTQTAPHAHLGTTSTSSSVCPRA